MKANDASWSARDAIAASLILAVAAIAWQLLAVANGGKNALFVSPRDLTRTAAELIARKGLIRHAGASVALLLTGLTLAIASAVPAGIIIGRNAFARKWVLPLFKALSPVPPIACTPLIVVALGVGPFARVFIVFLGCFFPVLFSTIQGVAAADPRLLMSARVHGASELTVVSKVLFRSAFGSILGGVRIASSMGLVMLVVAELFGGRNGIGYLLMQAKEFLRLPQMLVCALVLGLLGTVLHRSLDLVERRWESWRGGDANDPRD